MENTFNERFLEIILLYLDSSRDIQPRAIQDRLDPLTYYSDNEFRIRYRITKHCFVGLLDRIGDQLRRLTRRARSIPHVLQVLIFVRFCASGSFQVNHKKLLTTMFC